MARIRWLLVLPIDNVDDDLDPIDLVVDNEDGDPNDDDDGDDSLLLLLEFLLVLVRL